MKHLNTNRPLSSSSDRRRLKRLGVLVAQIAICLPVCLANATDALATDPKSAEPDRPNFLFLVADDLGFADISRTGSEIATPNIDSIANQGIFFSRFYTAFNCAPTRAMLLTGVDHHRTGLGNMADLLTDRQRGQPGYEGYLNRRVRTIPELLSESGYHSYMVGKWHLGMEEDQIPSARGFDRSFALMDGGASHFSDMAGATTFHPHAVYRDDGVVIEELPEDFYSTRFYTDKLVEYIDENLSDGNPFFAYVAYTAPHWPLQAPDDIRDLYRSAYDAGYDEIRKQRYSRLKELGLIPADATYPKRSGIVPHWTQLTDEERKIAARKMEIYAAMVAELDNNIGRLLAFLREREQLENTVIVFLSDNGADSFTLQRAPAHIADHARLFDNSLENMGRVNSFTLAGTQWANVGEAPFRLYKMMPSEGGVRSPTAIWYPAMNGPGGIVNSSVTSVMDLAPTVLALAGVKHPSGGENETSFAPDGHSLVDMLAGRRTAVRGDQDILGIEMLGRRAIIKGRWKAMRIPEPAGTDKWELFDLEVDPGEQIDLAEQEPEKLRELVTDWNSYQSEMRVVLP